MQHKRLVGIWIYSISVMVLMMVVIGGVTRLTGSGLSIVEWKPLMGAIPPLNHTDWLEVFSKYQESPQYKLVNQGMNMEQFQWIFFWEYFHRLIGRLIGVVFFFPFVFFIWKKHLNKKWVSLLLLGFAIGGLQGLMGWLMVKSGLVDEPRVSHFRLAAHLLLAMLIFIYFFWLGFKWNVENLSRKQYSLGNFKPSDMSMVSKILGVLTLLCVVQIFYGALVAGLRAGYLAGTFPLMDGKFFPSGGLLFKPIWMNFFNNPLTVQWTHRCIAWLLYFSIFLVWVLFRKKLDSVTREYLNLLFIWINLQFILGVTVILTSVNMPLAVLHQVGAFAVLGYLLITQWQLQEYFYWTTEAVPSQVAAAAEVNNTTFS
jgi:cytochrome c oxidase assembly protein subunit 15